MGLKISSSPIRFNTFRLSKLIKWLGWKTIDRENIMQDIPDFTEYGYQIKAELGRNREGGRITWKAIELSTEKLVVIKQFCFATVGSSWSGYKAYKREIKLLQQLDHPGIPRYLDSLETDNGFCLIQEYKDSISLQAKQDLTLADIKIIITKILEILVYLQQQTPPIIHCDLKPANILVDDRLNVSLVDFGLASHSNQETTASSVLKGTPGFIPPEIAIAPNTASDLYSLGVTIICLLTGKTALDIQQLVTADNPYQLKFKSLLPHLNPKFIRWLTKMVQPKLRDRFLNATEALTAFQSLDLTPQSNSDISLFSTLAAQKWELNFTVVGLTAMFGLSTASVLAMIVTIHRVEFSLFNLLVAIIGAVVITTMEMGVMEISVGSEAINSKRNIIAVAVAIPTLVVIVAGLILGIQEAIAICCAIAIAQAITFAYFLADYLKVQGFSLEKTTINFLLAIVLGIACGLGLSIGFL